MTGSLKVCEICDSGYYLREGKCYEARAGCINYLNDGSSESGKCL